jgi:hypothetical protein
MNEASKKSAMQAALLVGLLLVLGFAVFRMINSMQTPKRNRDKARTTASASKDSSARPSSTNMPRVTGSAGDTGGKGSGVEIEAGDLRLNPNQFKVYALNPPKNPFVQEPEWYQDKLEQVPGYPQLKNSDYFESNEAYLPNIPLIHEEQWEEIVVDRTVTTDPYEISGASADGSVMTRVQLKPKGEESERLAWNPATGVPLKALFSPDWKDAYGDKLSGELPVAQTEEAPSSGFVADALGVPGAPGDRSASELLDGSNGAGTGSTAYCVGISHHGKEATAMIRYNGKTRIVREGSVLPTRFQVLSIKEDGVVLIDLSDGSSQWLPLGAAPAANKDSAKKTRKVNDA